MLEVYAILFDIVDYVVYSWETNKQVAIGMEYYLKNIDLRNLDICIWKFKFSERVVKYTRLDKKIINGVAHNNDIF